MTSKRRKWVIAAACAVLAITIALLLARKADKEPTYQGKRLSEWVALLGDDGAALATADIPQVELALRSMGTNALPYLLECISYELPPWRTKVRRKLPEGLATDRKVERLVDGAAQDRSGAALLAFSLPGTNASPAIPALATLMQDSRTPHRAGYAILALGDIGEAAFPVLTNALANPHQIRRPAIILAIGSQTGTNLCLPILLAALSDQDFMVRFAATNELRRLAPEALTNAPPR